MSLYFTVSGFNALLDVDAKLERVGLSAIDSDGRIAFILIYCSLMVGIGVAISLLYFFSKKWIYPALLATVIVASFVVFRVVGSCLAGGFSDTQITFLLVELAEVSLGLFLLYQSGGFSKKLI